MLPSFAVPTTPVPRRQPSVGIVLVLLLVLLLQPSSAAFASAQESGTSPAAGDVEEQQPPPDPEEVLEDLIVVTASRTEEPLLETASSITVLEGEELAAVPAVSLDEALRYTPGFSLFRRSSSLVAQPTTQGVSLRGIGPSGVSRTLVLLDGIVLNDPFGGWVTWSRVPVVDLERVEIVRGGGSDAWGSAALGGVIQLFTRRADDTRAEGLLEVGERSSGRADLFASHDAERWRASIHGDALDHGGYHQRRRDQRGPIDIPADSRHWQLAGRVGGELGEGGRWGARLERFDEERSNGTPLTDNSTQLDAVTFSADWQSGPRLGWTARLHGQDQEFAARFSSQADDRSSETPALDQFLVGTESFSGSALSRFLGGRHSLVGGFDFRVTEGATNERYFFSAGDFLRQRRAGGDELLAGFFLQDGFSLADGLELQLGLRFDRWESSNGMRVEFDRETGEILLDERFEDRSEEAVSPRLGLSWEAAERVHLRTSAYRSFRSPTINELYRPFRVGNDITAANAGLEPEELTGAEVGVDWTGRAWRWSTTVFHNRLDEPVSNVTLAFGPGVIQPCGFTPSGGSCRQRQNLGRSVIEGAESELHVRWSRGSASLSYQLSDAIVEDAPNAPPTEGMRLPQVPRHSAALRSDLRLDERWTAELGVRYGSRQFEDDLNERPLDSYLLTSLGARWSPADAWTAYIRVDNAFDEDVQVGLSGTGIVTVGPPRTVRAGLRWRWNP